MPARRKHPMIQWLTGSYRPQRHGPTPWKPTPKPVSAAEERANFEALGPMAERAADRMGMAPPGRRRK